MFLLVLLEKVSELPAFYRKYSIILNLFSLSILVTFYTPKPEGVSSSLKKRSQGPLLKCEIAFSKILTKEEI